MNHVVSNSTPNTPGHNLYKVQTAKMTGTTSYEIKTAQTSNNTHVNIYRMHTNNTSIHESLIYDITPLRNDYILRMIIFATSFKPPI